MPLHSRTTTIAAFDSPSSSDYRPANGRKATLAESPKSFAAGIRSAAPFGSKPRAPGSDRTTMDRLRRIVLLVCLTAAWGLLTPVASRADGGATGFIKQKQSQVSTLLHEPPSRERERRVGAILDSMIDYDDLAERSMQNHWDELTAAQKKEFTRLLKQLVQRSYERNIKGILDWNVEYLDEEPSGAGVSVHSRATSKNNPRAEPVTIEYKMVKTSQGFRVYDIVTEGSSLVNNYKNQFNRIMQKDGYDALIRRMKTKVAEGGEAHAR
jgi:phospholipid transport system substrate-binding protein